MRERIKQIMDHEHLNSSEFADKLGIGRAVISHILNGRNNPSLDVVTRILSKIDNIDPEWLISGKGNMLKLDTSNISNNNVVSSQIELNTKTNAQADLFSTQSPVESTVHEDNSKYGKENTDSIGQNGNENTINKDIIYKKVADKKISKIIIYYTDNTFESFSADSSPL